MWPSHFYVFFHLPTLNICCHPKCCPNQTKLKCKRKTKWAMTTDWKRPNIKQVLKKGVLALTNRLSRARKTMKVNHFTVKRHAVLFLLGKCVNIMQKNEWKARECAYFLGSTQWLMMLKNHGMLKQMKFDVHKLLQIIWTI